MKNTKTVFGMYSAWGYKREIEDLNKMSQKGWHLTKPGLWCNRFTKNESIRYVYQLDYNTKIDDKARYIETFREQGWEYINSTYNGWHYFRKLYDPSLPQEEYEIYCDNQSLSEMQNRWNKLGLRMAVLIALALILELYVVIRKFTLPTAVLCLTLFLELLLILHGVVFLKKSQKNDAKEKKSYKITGIPLVFLIGFIITITGMCFRPDNVRTKAESYGKITAENPVNLNQMKIYYPDYYHFDLNGELAGPLTVSFVNVESGKVIFTKVLEPQNGQKFEVEINRNYLEPGEYNWILSDFEGGKMDLNILAD